MRAEWKHLYNSARWLRRRAEQLRLHPFCSMCLVEGRERLGFIADHIVPHKGDAVLFYEGELDTLCKHHHDSAKQALDRTGKLRGFNELGEPIDPRHPWNASRTDAEHVGGMAEGEGGRNV